MDIKTALKHMSVEKAIELEERRFFCNADETVNSISISSMEKQIPIAPKIVPKPLVDGKFWWYCGKCGTSRHTDYRSNYCPYCGQRVDWSEYLRENNADSKIIDKASISFPELLKGE